MGAIPNSDLVEKERCPGLGELAKHGFVTVRAAVHCRDYETASDVADAMCELPTREQREKDADLYDSMLTHILEILDAVLLRLRTERVDRLLAHHCRVLRELVNRELRYHH